MRWLAILLTLSLGTSADAQGFKPKGKSSGSSAKASSGGTKSAKKATAKSTKKKSSKSAKKSPAPRSDDGASEVASKDSDRDFVKITDDEEIE